MFTKFELPTGPATPRWIFAMNKRQIFERLDSGSSMTLAFRELNAQLSDSKVKYPKLVYSTFRRFVAREKAKSTVQNPTIAKAGKTPSPSPTDKPASSPAPGTTEREPQQTTGFPLREVSSKAGNGSLSPGEF